VKKRHPIGAGLEGLGHRLLRTEKGYRTLIPRALYSEPGGVADGAPRGGETVIIDGGGPLSHGHGPARL